MRIKLLKVTFILGCIFLWSIASLKAQECKATAPSKVGINESIQYTVRVNEKPSKVAAQDFGTFTLQSGPSTSYSSSTSWVNGQVTSSTEYSYTYVLRPTKLGEQTIPGVTFVLNGKQVKSNSVKVVVTQENQRAQQQQAQRRSSFWDFPEMTAPPREISKDDIMLKAFASKSNPYQGEEVIVTHKLYLSNNIHNFQPTNNELPSQPDLWTYTLGNPDAEVKHTVENLNGKRYEVYELRKTAVYPQKSGTITITPLELEGIVTIPSGFFGRQEKMTIKSNSVTLNVKPLPTNGKPANFSGLVGTFSMKSSLTKDEMESNDATNLLITISGKGNLQLIENPNITFPNDFDVTEPTINDKIQTGGSNVNGSRTFEYVIIPRVAGKFTIPSAEFTYFDLSSNSYKTLTTESYELTVAKGNNEESVSNSSYQKDIQILDKDIRYIKTKNTSCYKRKAPFFGTPMYLALLFSPLFVFVILLILWRKRIQSRENIAQLRNKRANKVALKRLKTAKKMLTENKEEAFYIEISRALWGYMSDKFHIPIADLSMDTVRQRLTEKEVSDEDIEQFIHTLNECEFARFAPGDSAQLMSNLYNSSIQFITQIEKK
ncbi:MAG: protein BatD [Bacteroidales bacterium]|nr:protein BatD [Bacteroidales bacterium]